MPTITNLSRIGALLNGDVQSTDTTKTVGLTVIATNVREKTVTVQSANNADVQVLLRDVTGIPVGAVVSLDLVSGELTTVSTPAPVAQPAAPARRGCTDRSFINY